jgi:AmmeMemoRadiSam system protein A
MSQPSDHPLLVSVPHGAAPEYDPDERKILLQIAHESILSFSPPSPHLAEPRGVFTTLYSDQKLRGCVGYPTAILPLYRAVAETARAAANDDPRFPAVSLSEARQLQISISVLSPLHTVLPDQIEIGIHGLVISQGTRRGLLLPQVPLEHGWDREVFLEQTCMKAGLASDAWRGGAHIEAFTAEVFADSGFAAGY